LLGLAFGQPCAPRKVELRLCSGNVNVRSNVNVNCDIPLPWFGRRGVMLGRSEIFLRSSASKACLGDVNFNPNVNPNVNCELIYFKYVLASPCLPLEGLAAEGGFRVGRGRGRGTGVVDLSVGVAPYM
jgi:hypothetical protein